MFRMTLTLRLTRMARLRDLYPRAVRNLEARLQQNARPKIENDVQQILAPYPGAALYPFQFATARSRRYYFWRFKGQIPYTRTTRLAQSWITAIGGGLDAGPLSIIGALVRQTSVAGTLQLVIANTDPASRYVYPTNQVPGHHNTGWNLDRRQQVLDLAKEHVLEEWGPALTEAIEKG